MLVVGVVVGIENTDLSKEESSLKSHPKNYIKVAWMINIMWYTMYG